MAFLQSRFRGRRRQRQEAGGQEKKRERGTGKGNLPFPRYPYTRGEKTGVLCSCSLCPCTHVGIGRTVQLGIPFTTKKDRRFYPVPYYSTAIRYNQLEPYLLVRYVRYIPDSIVETGQSGTEPPTCCCFESSRACKSATSSRARNEGTFSLLFQYFIVK